MHFYFIILSDCFCYFNLYAFLFDFLKVPERNRFGADKHRKEAPYFQFLKSQLVPFQIICTRKTRHQSIRLDESYRRIPVTLGNCRLFLHPFVFN